MLRVIVNVIRIFLFYWHLLLLLVLRRLFLVFMLLIFDYIVQFMLRVANISYGIIALSPLFRLLLFIIVLDYGARSRFIKMFAWLFRVLRHLLFLMQLLFIFHSVTRVVLFFVVGSFFRILPLWLYRNIRVRWSHPARSLRSVKLLHAFWFSDW